MLNDTPFLNVLLVGSGGREHALAWKLKDSKRVARIFVVPGNGGTATLGPKVENVANVSADKFQQLLELAIEKDVRLVIPGPEDPLVKGIVDYFEENGPAKIKCFGPSKAAARLEGEKTYAKDFMKRHRIPTAAFETFQSFEKAKEYLQSKPESYKVVLKANGLAAGKGVIIPQTREEALHGLSRMMVNLEFGDAGASVVIEELLEGEEISILSFSDGYTVRSLPAAQDHKRIYDDDKGPNTGGMGCYAPTQVANSELMLRIHRETLQPTIDGIRNEDAPFRGCLFTGFMLTKDGPKVLEYNVRFGDPECQTLFPLLKTDLAEIILKSTLGTLSSTKLEIESQKSSATVVAASEGYPGTYNKGIEMNLEDVESDTVLFHAGTKYNPESKLHTTSGGRVIASTAIGSGIKDAVKRAYAGLERVRFDRMHFRRDIAARELNRKPPSTTPSTDRSSLTYASAGVSIDKGNEVVKLIKKPVRSTARSGADALIEGFGGEFSLRKAGYGADAPTIIGAIDGIGTKLMVAKEMNDYTTIGEDLVAMNVNDLVVQGAEPLLFLDYYACGELVVENCVNFVSSVAEGCKKAHCALIGGETAEMPGVYDKGVFDAAGCAVGAVPRGRTILPAKDAMKEGDILLGLASSGPHSNGFSLTRRIVEESKLSYTSQAPWDNSISVGQALLTPTRIYVKSLLQVLNETISADGTSPLKGMAHITGGGLTENVPRMLPDHLAACLEIGSWPVPASLQWLKSEGHIKADEFARTFNTGLGMVCVVEATAINDVEVILAEAKEKSFRVGKLLTRREGQTKCILHNIESW